MSNSVKNTSGKVLGRDKKIPVFPILTAPIRDFSGKNSTLAPVGLEHPLLKPWSGTFPLHLVLILGLFPGFDNHGFPWEKS